MLACREREREAPALRSALVLHHLLAFFARSPKKAVPPRLKAWDPFSERWRAECWCARQNPPQNRLFSLPLLLKKEKKEKEKSLAARLIPDETSYFSSPLWFSAKTTFVFYQSNAIMVCNKVLKKPQQRRVRRHLRVLEISSLRLRPSQQQDPARLPLLHHPPPHIRFPTWNYARQSD